MRQARLAIADVRPTECPLDSGGTTDVPAEDFHGRYTRLVGPDEATALRSWDGGHAGGWRAAAIRSDITRVQGNR